MTGFRLLLVAMLASLLVYTFIVIMNHGPDLTATMLRDLAAMGWPGQFNLDFAYMLLLTGLWVAWRHKFSPTGLALGALATVGGILFLTIYLLVASVKSGGQIRVLLLGEQLNGD